MIVHIVTPLPAVPRHLNSHLQEVFSKDAEKLRGFNFTKSATGKATDTTETLSEKTDSCSYR